jgi:cytochrome b6-f complex iron-sulfur subunit
MAQAIHSTLAALVLVIFARLRRDTGSTVPRRRFVRNLVLGGVGLAGLQMGGSALAFAWPLKTSTFGTPVPILPAQIPEVGDPPFRHQAGKFYLINNDEGLLALYWKCPHLGCTVPWREDEDAFKCPCHSSEYNRYGELVDGPAPRPMDLMGISVDDAGNLIVDTGDIRERSAFTPDQATRI